MQNRERSSKNSKVGPGPLALKTGVFYRREKSPSSSFPTCRPPVGFSPKAGQILGCLPAVGSSCGHPLENFSVTWTASEENLGRAGLSSCSTIWKVAGQAPLTTKAACNSTPHPWVYSLSKLCGWVLGGHRNILYSISTTHNRSARVMSGSQEESGREGTRKTNYLSTFS